jgi:hypothetical protein
MFALQAFQSNLIWYTISTWPTVRAAMEEMHRRPAWRRGTVEYQIVRVVE